MHCIKRPARLSTKSSRFCSPYSTAARRPRPVLVLPDSTISTFRAQAFHPESPALLPRGHFSNLPACQKWFDRSGDTAKTVSLNASYLSKFGEAGVNVESYDPRGGFDVSLEPFQSFIDASTNPTNPTDLASTSIYLAQTSLSSLPPDLVNDVGPTPSVVLESGKGDIYSSSIWLGRAPTYTPLHRDPNPNLFVQLAGTKRVRLFCPEEGAMIFHFVQSRIDGHVSPYMRGPEMMEGDERRELESAVWDDWDEEAEREGRNWGSRGLECELQAGDALFIPKRWWHSVKGVGEGMNGSVNWWFR